MQRLMGETGMRLKPMLLGVTAVLALPGFAYPAAAGQNSDAGRASDVRG
jgi:hypothetical protein